MSRKLAHAFAALIVMVIGSLVWAQPAQAAPNGLCSIEQWQDPGNWVRCADGWQDVAGNATGCVSAPSPNSPTSGMAGWFADRPDSSLRDGVQGQYSIYGVAGYGLDTYDLGCLGTLKYPDLTAWSMIANGEFQTAAATMGAANWLRERAYDPASIWGWSDSLITQATDAGYQYVFSTVGVIVMIGIGVFLLWTARQGNLSHTMKITAWAFFILTVTVCIAKFPERAVHTTDSVATSTLTGVHAVFGPAPQDIPEDKCVLGGDACKDNRTVATRASDVATHAVLYRTWLRAVLGDADSQVARAYGPALFDATTMSWGEAARVDGNPALRDQLIKEKAATFQKIANHIQQEDPVAYEYLQGNHGMDRAFAGFIGMLSAGAFVLFDAAASIVILFAYGVLRWAIPLLPLFATFGLFQPAAAGVHRIFDAAVASIVNIAVFGAAAGFYLTCTDEIFNSDLPAFAQFVVILLIGVGAILITRPVRLMVATATGRSRDKESYVRRAFRGGKAVLAERHAPAETTTTETTEASDVPARPEAATRTRITRSVRHVADAAYPSVGETLNGDILGAGAEAARNRPEGDTRLAQARRYVGAAATAAGKAATAGGKDAAAGAATAVADPPEPGPATEPKRPRSRPRSRPAPDKAKD